MGEHKTGTGPKGIKGVGRQGDKLALEQRYVWVEKREASSRTERRRIRKLALKRGVQLGEDGKYVDFKTIVKAMKAPPEHTLHWSIIADRYGIGQAEAKKMKKQLKNKSRSK